MANPFSMGVWKKFMGLSKKPAKYGPSNPAPGAGTKTLQSVEINNAKSWNKETHPDGIGPSYLVDKISYSTENNELIVTYRDGFTAKYENITPDMADDFSKADSKGRWARAHLWNLPYTEV